MPKLLCARPPQDATEERQVHKLAGSRHAPADWIRRAQMIVLSWQGLRTRTIAEELSCHQQTVRERLLAFNARGLDGLGDRPGAGRKRRITETERSTLVALVAWLPPGRLVLQSDGSLGPQDEAHEEEPARLHLKRADRGRPAAGYPDQAQSGAAHSARRRGSLAPHPLVGEQRGSPLRPKRTAVVSRYTDPPGTTLCTDELGPVTPRLHAPPPGWSPDGHRIKAPLEDSRGADKVWFYGALRVRDGHALTLSAPARNTVGYVRLLTAIDQDNPTGELYLVADNLSSHKSPPIQAWLAEHPRVHLVFIPTKACWLNLQEGWWRLFRREALAGQDFCGATDLDEARRVATAQLNRRAKPWVWGRPPPKHRKLRRKFVYCL